MPNDFYEKTVEDIIFENRSIIHNYGLPKFRDVTFRQFVLPSGKKIDIFSYDLIDGHIVIYIYELKRYEINTDAICQAYNYFMEVNQYIGGIFKSIDIHIIMIGRYYDPVMIFEKMNLPFSVYTYDYQLSGMRFQKHQERKNIKTPHEDFSLGLWGFGEGYLHYPNGQPDTVNIGNAYSFWRNVNKESHNQILIKAGNIFQEPLIKEIVRTEVKVITPIGIKTEIFPLQPSWTTEFAKTIPDDEHLFDLDHDDCDLEIEPIEADLSDFEPDIMEIDETECDESLVYMGATSNFKDDEHVLKAEEFIKKIQLTA